MLVAKVYRPREKTDLDSNQPIEYPYDTLRRRLFVPLRRLTSMSTN